MKWPVPDGSVDLAKLNSGLPKPLTNAFSRNLRCCFCACLCPAGSPEKCWSSFLLRQWREGAAFPSAAGSALTSSNPSLSESPNFQQDIGKYVPNFRSWRAQPSVLQGCQAGLAISCPFSGEIVPDSYLSPFRCTQTGLDQSTTCLELHHGLLPHLFWLSNNCIIQFLYKSKRNVSSCKRSSIELGYLWEWVRKAHLLEWKSLL